uniref:Ribonuclease H-like domain, reverse transcriptase, RNA-dependent DNA polymerase n=1 Tax=Tanacetum cinerariifolium TaxID=118510 RepID=A0A6L2MHZ2_TANCI|nr:ribonuclease H-like domain, reverse transcriptase, RNA-dependent DNA polymerase [Tanacetum cinerariifolium]
MGVTDIAFNVELSPTKPDKVLSQSNSPSALIIEDWVSDSEDESEAGPSQNVPSFVQSIEQVKTPRPSGKHVEHSIPAANHKADTPNPKSHGNNRNRKACFVCKSLTHLIKDCDYYENKMAQTPARNHAQRGNHQHYSRMTHPDPQRHVIPTIVLTKSKLVPLTAARPVTTTVPQPHVTRPRPAKTVVTKPHSPPRRNINRRPSPKPSNLPYKVTTAKVSQVNVVKGVQGNWGNPHHDLKDKIVIDSGCSRHMTGNMSYLSVFEETNGEYVAFGRNPKGGKINDTECIILSLEFKLPDENQVLLRVPRENNMYNVDLKNIGPSGDLTCLFAKATLDESNLWHRKLGDINFKTMNKMLKEPEFKVKNPESEVHVSPSSSAKTKKHDDKTKREAKGKSHVELSTGYRNLSVEFEDFLITTLMSAAGPFNNVVSPALEESSYVDTSQYPDDPNMPALKDITYSDDEDDVGAEADFTNLETNIIELLQFKMQKVWVLVDLPNGKRAIGTKYVFRNKKDERGIVVKNKAQLVAQGHTQEEGIDYKEVFAPVARIEAIRLFLAYASFIGFVVYQMDVKSAFLYGTIEEEVAEILRKFSLTYGKSASTSIDTEKPLLKDPDGEDVDVQIYISMIGSLMYLTSSRPDIMFAVCACARFQVTPKASHLHAVKRIFRFLKGKPHLGLWYLKDSPFNLVAYSNSDYAGASLVRKSTTGGCQFFRCRLISWQCKKQTFVATSSTEAEYVAAASCCAQVLWIQNQLLDYRANCNW